MILPQKHTAADTTIFTKMSALAAQHNAINLSQGFPDFPIDDKLSQLLGEAALQGHNQYAPMPGLPMLREAIAQDVSNRYGVATQPDLEVTITPGATYGLYVAIAASISKGDEVIVLEPAYDSYIPAIEMNGGVAITVPLRDSDFSVDWERVKAAISLKTRAIIINTPNNPAGSLLSENDVATLAALAGEHNLIVIADEVYEQLVFDGAQHHSVWQNETLRQRSFVVYSFGKVFQQTGWKMGYVLANEAMTKAFRRVHQYLCFSVNTPAQYALAQYLQLPEKPDVRTLIQHRRDYFLRLMTSTPFRMMRPAAGSYFQVMSYAAFSDMPDVAFAEWLTQTHGVAVIPLSAFYQRRSDNKLVRFCFAKKEETLEEAAQRLSRL